MCVCVSSGSWLCSCVLRIFGSPVVWVIWRFGPSQLLQMVRAQQLNARGERGGSVVITSWLGGSAKAVSKTSAATGTRGCECRLYGGPWCLRGQVLVCVYVYAVSRYSTCIYICLRVCVCVFVVCVAFNAHQRGGPHMTYFKPGAFSTTFNVLPCAAFWADTEKLILVAVFLVLISQQYKIYKYQVM